MDRASSYFFSLISLANLAEPATLVFSPIFIKLFSLLLITTSSPQYILSLFILGIDLGCNPSTASAIAFI